MNETIGIGSPVRLVIGGPQMIVYSITDGDDGITRAGCLWWGEEVVVGGKTIRKLLDQSFPLTALRYVDVEAEYSKLRALLAEVSEVYKDAEMREKSKPPTVTKGDYLATTFGR